jgi:hypothetical protein
MPTWVRHTLLTRCAGVAVLLPQDTQINTRGHAEVWTSPSERTTRDALLMEVGSRTDAGCCSCQHAGAALLACLETSPYWELYTAYQSLERQHHQTTKASSVPAKLYVCVRARMCHACLSAGAC